MLPSSECRLLNDFLYDSHCHLRRIPPSALQAAAPGPLAGAPGAGSQCSNAAWNVTGLVLCGTHPSIDWDAVAQASATPATAVIGFGVHPWFVPSAASSPQEAAPYQVAEKTFTSSPFLAHSSGEVCCGSSNGSTEAKANIAAPGAVALTLPSTLRLLRERLQQHPFAIVAEIGLDKLRGPPEPVQVEAFVAQLRLAAAYCRPVSVHCVRHYGLLLQLLQDLPAEHTPPAIILHAFTGSLEVAKSLLSLKNKRRMPSADGGATGDRVRIKDVVFFGVGVSTSFAVKNFATQTLPFLLDARRVLLETDEHYSGVEAQAAVSSGEVPAEAEIQPASRNRSSARVRVDPREHIAKLVGVMERVRAAMLENLEFAKKAEASGVSVEAALQDALLHAYSAAFRSVSGEKGTR
ncbi:hypothetical protein LSCM1_00436 [Leishmania martiniquensis]|uniref:TatD related DNase n=1 Tax=Leishmania martiniquensis TaxID=1580590 RepID=A0A836KB17_9TRYP|nr:hypothetical protein LSCM1_00436 [Leishmania martiniquensis]